MKIWHQSTPFLTSGDTLQALRVTLLNIFLLGLKRRLDNIPQTVSCFKLEKAIFPPVKSLLPQHTPAHILGEQVRRDLRLSVFPLLYGHIWGVIYVQLYTVFYSIKNKKFLLKIKNLLNKKFKYTTVKDTLSLISSLSKHLSHLSHFVSLFWAILEVVFLKYLFVAAFTSYNDSNIYCKNIVLCLCLPSILY